MLDVKLTGDWDLLMQALRRGSSVSFLEIHQAIGAYNVSETTRRFRQTIAPDGNRWQKSQRVLDHGGKTLTDRGTLRRSIRSFDTRHRSDTGTNVKYGPAHNDKPKKAGRIRRQFLGMNRRNQKEIIELVMQMTALRIVRGKVVSA